MDSTSETHAAQPGFAHGRNAAIVHGLAFVAAGAAGAGVYAVQGSSSDDAGVILGVGLAAVAVLWLWSGVLAIRALWKAERPIWPVLVLGLMLLELCPLALAFWFEQYSYGIPVLFPFFTLATFIAVPIAVWRVRRTEKSAAQAAHPQWTRRQRWKRGLLWYGAVSGLLTILLLPWPLFLYCATSGPFDEYEPRNLTEDWRDSVIAVLPQFVRDGTSEAVFRVAPATTKPLNPMVYGVLCNGQLSKPKLIECLSLPSPYDRIALQQLDKVDRAVALEFSERIGRLQFPPGGIPSNNLLDQAGYLIGLHGSVAQVTYYLQNPSSSPAMRRCILLAYRTNPRPELQPFIEEVARSGTAPDASIAVRALANVAPAKDVERFFLELLNGPAPGSRLAAVQRIGSIKNSEVREKLELTCLNHTDPLVRYEVLLRSFFEIQPATAAQTARWLERADRLLDEPNLNLRRCAVQALGALLKIKVRSTIAPDSPTPATILPETPAEIEELKQIREAARRWLEQNKQN